MRRMQSRQGNSRADLTNMLRREKEAYLRLCVCLVECLMEGRKPDLVAGHVAVDKETWVGVPKRWKVNIQGVTVERKLLDGVPVEGELGDDVEGVVSVETSDKVMLVMQRADPETRLVVPDRMPEGL